MMNQEAIDELIIVRNVYDGMREAYKPCVEAIDMAISALQAQEAKTQLSAKDICVPCKDTISRQAAIGVCDNAIDLWHGQLGEGIVIAVKKKIEELPSAQPETAKRIVGKSRNGMTLWYQCDMCNEPVDAQDDFCRGCGRRLTDG